MSNLEPASRRGRRARQRCLDQEEAQSPGSSPGTSPLPAVARARAVATAGATPAALPTRAVTCCPLDPPSLGYHRLRRLARRKMSLECREALVKMSQLFGLAPNRGSLPRDQLAEFDRHLVAVAGLAQDRELARSCERKVERTQANEEPEPLGVRRCVVAIAVRRAVRRRQQAHRLVEPHRLRGRTCAARDLADSHADTLDLPVAGMSRARVHRAIPARITAGRRSSTSPRIPIGAVRA